jgi:hypothetical protein
MDTNTIPTFCPTCGDTAEWCPELRKAERAIDTFLGVPEVKPLTEAQKDALRARGAANRAAVRKPVRKPRRRLNKAQALVDMGECRTLAEARAYLRDMGEYR